MILNREQAVLKAQAHLDPLTESIRSAAESLRRIDQVERELMAPSLQLGLPLLKLFIAHHGDGDLRATAGAADGRTAQRQPQPHQRRDVSTFGELTIARIVPSDRGGRKIERVPLDEPLGPPAGDFSCVAEDWVRRFSVKSSFTEAVESLQVLLRLRLGAALLSSNRNVVIQAILTVEAGFDHDGCGSERDRCIG